MSQTYAANVEEFGKIVNVLNQGSTVFTDMRENEKARAKERLVFDHYT